MITEIKSCFKTLRENIYIAAKNNDVLFETADYKIWNEKLIQRSKALRTLYIENEEAIKRLRALSENMDREGAATIFNELRVLKKEELHDSATMIEFCERLLSYYEDGKHLSEVIFLHLNLAYEKMEYFLRMDKKGMAQDVKKHLLEVIKLKDYYASIPTVEGRRAIYIALYNLVGPLPDLIQEWKKDQIGYYEMAMELFASPAGQIDKEEELILNEIYYLKEMMLLDFPSYIDSNPDIQRKYFSLVDSFITEFQDEEYEITLYSIVKEYCNHEITSEIALERLLEIYKENYENGVPYDTSEEAIFEFGNMNDLAISIFVFLSKANLPKEKKKEIADYISKPVLSFISNVSFKDYSSYFDDASAEIFQNLLPYARSIEEKENLLLKLVIKRQPITYIHSLMVERISKAILDEILLNSCELKKQFMTLDFENEEEIRGYISRAARLHDMGKCLTVGVINQQSRRLTDYEFTYIKLHPEKALELVQGDSDFSPYFDVMIGHHRFYDGTKGYPIDFDVTKSRYKIAIDLITIADCLDAATDILGRNYTTGKSFTTVLGELESEKGTRYNPEIVDFISSNVALRKKLDYLTGMGRNQSYYEAYKSISKQKD